MPAGHGHQVHDATRAEFLFDPCRIRGVRLFQGARTDVILTKQAASQSRHENPALIRQSRGHGGEAVAHPIGKRAGRLRRARNPGVGKVIHPQRSTAECGWAHACLCANLHAVVEADTGVAIGKQPCARMRGCHARSFMHTDDGDIRLAISPASR